MRPLVPSGLATVAYNCYSCNCSLLFVCLLACFVIEIILHLSVGCVYLVIYIQRHESFDFEIYLNSVIVENQTHK